MSAVFVSHAFIRREGAPVGDVHAFDAHVCESSFGITAWDIPGVFRRLGAPAAKRRISVELAMATTAVTFMHRRQGILAHWLPFLTSCIRQTAAICASPHFSFVNQGEC